MPKKANNKVFIDDLYSTSPKKTFETDKIIYNHIDELCSIDLAYMIDYKISNNKGFRYIFIILDIFNKYLWAIPLKNKNSQKMPDFSIILTTLKRSPNKLESDRGAEF